METISTFFGRSHPLVVHLPIGFLFLAFIFECLALRPAYKKIRAGVAPGLILGAVLAIIACITGYDLWQEGGYDDSLVGTHQVLGILTAIMAVAVVLARRKVKSFLPDAAKRKKARVILFIPLIILLSLTGHWGGSITHGEDYLSFESLVPVVHADPAWKIKATANLDTAILYADIVQPVLEAKCYDCHSSRKQKGELRLDAPTFIQHGGKHGVVLSTLADSSELFKRLMLPLEDKKHMPPNKKPQLSFTEIAIIQAWISGGASFDKKVSDHVDHGKLIGYLKLFQRGPEQVSLVPEKEVEVGDEEVITQLRSAGVMVMPVSESGNYLQANFLNSKSVDGKMIDLLTKLKKQLVWLKLSHTSVSDREMAGIGEFPELRTLYLDNTGVTDAGLAYMRGAVNLRILSVVGTNVTDKGLDILSDLPELRKIYLYQTSVTPAGIQRFVQKSGDVLIDSGNYQLERLATDTVVYKRKI